MREIAVRTVLRVIDGLFMYLVGLVVMLVTGQRRQRLGDMAAGTMVVDAGERPRRVARRRPQRMPVAPEAPEGAPGPGGRRRRRDSRGRDAGPSSGQAP